MIPTSNTQSPFSLVNSWHKKRLNSVAQQSLQANQEGYQSEIRQFKDAFESVAALDGAPIDKNSNPGEVSCDADLLSGKRSLIKTDYGFALRVGTTTTLMGPFIGGLWTGSENPLDLPALRKTTRQETEYQINEKTGAITVTRDTINASENGTATTTRTFTLDPDAGLIRDEATKTNYSWERNPISVGLASGMGLVSPYLNRSSGASA